MMRLIDLLGITVEDQEVILFDNKGKQLESFINNKNMNKYNNFEVITQEVMLGQLLIYINL